MSKELHSPTPPRSVPQHRENDGDDKSVSSQRIRKRDRFMNLFRSSSPEPKVKVRPQNSSPKVAAYRLSTTSVKASVHRLSAVNTHDILETEQVVASTAAQGPVSKPEPSTLSTEPCRDIFTQNVDKPTVAVSLPGFGTRISTTPQLVLCIGMLPRDDNA
ncbi:hypothetical protein BGX24_004548, partial [Mortierella sp. AD032]